ncbi:MAG: DUF4235 domain-containing protein [Salinisphaera sp.]|uniref:DUF4235 domain-containing protein n=1 Tax=Salinisphaera sp. TaxID=1914330 RepID=UPI003C7EA480
MPMNRDKTIWLALGAGAAIGAGLVARRGTAVAWRQAVGEEPPRHVADAEVGWTRLVAWAAISGVCVAAARLAGRGLAVTVYKRLLGRRPPES